MAVYCINYHCFIFKVGAQRGCTGGLKTRQQQIKSPDAKNEERPPLKMRINLKGLNSENQRNRAVVRLERLSFANFDSRVFIKDQQLSIVFCVINYTFITSEIERGRTKHISKIYFNP